MKKYVPLLILILSFHIRSDAQNFGIGTTTPMYPLTLVTPTGYGLVHTNDDVRIGTAIGTDLFGNGFGFLGTFSDHRLVFGAGESSMNNFIINPGGNIGIGTLPTGAKLNLIPSNPNQHILDIKNYFGGQSLLVSGYGNIGMGTSTPDYPLTLRTFSGYGFMHDNGFVRVGTYASGEDYGWIGTSSLHQLQIGAGGSAHISIEPNGFVGIGTTLPDATLDVNGSMKLEGLNMFEFGAGIIGKEPNAGKIGYKAFGHNALTFVGAGNDILHRAIYFYAEGGATVEGTMNITGSLTNPISLNVSGRTKLSKGGTDPVAVDINGGIRVSGTNPAAFLLTANSTNMCAEAYMPYLSVEDSELIRIDNEYCNNNPDAIIFVTPRNLDPVGVRYFSSDGYWYIFFTTHFKLTAYGYMGVCLEGLGNCVEVGGIPFNTTTYTFTENYSKFNVMILSN